jgi:hypothetical protein
MSLTKVTYSMIEGAVVNVSDFGAVGDGVTDDTAAFQAALNAAEGVVVTGNPGAIYYIKSTVICRTSGVTLDLLGSSITTDNFTAPVFSLADPANTSFAPDKIIFRNIDAVQTTTAVDIGGSTFYPTTQPENWKVAALIHRGKSVGKTTTIENVSGDNFINLISNWGDWQNETLASGPLIMRNIRTKRINFGLLDNGADYLEVDGWDDDDRVAIQIAGGLLMPPHAIYTLNHNCQASNYFIRNVTDRNTVHGSSVKLRQVAGFQISNVSGVKSPALVEIFNCDNGAVIGCNLADPVDDPALTLSQSAYWCVGCQNVSWVNCNADVIGDRKLIRVGDSDATGATVGNAGVRFEGHANFLGESWVIMATSGGGVSFDISITSSAAGSIRILRDFGSGTPALGDIQINIKSIFAAAPAPVVLYFLNTAGDAQIFYNPTTLVNVSGLSTAGASSAARIFTIPTGVFFGTGASPNIDMTSTDTGVVEYVASRVSSGRRGILRYDNSSDKWVFLTNGSVRAELDIKGLRYQLATSLSLATNGEFSIERVSDTQINLVYRGADGVTRKSLVTLS